MTFVQSFVSKAIYWIIQQTRKSIMPYQGYNDEDLLEILETVEQAVPVLDQFDKAFVTNILEQHDAYGKVNLTDRQRQHILSLKERYLLA